MDYHRNFYSQIPDDIKNSFSFEDLAGIYEQDGWSRLFVVCTRYAKIKGLKVLPQGKYLCADCKEENQRQVVKTLFETAKNRYGVAPEFTVQLIVLSGILQWNYQVQILIE